MFPSWKKSYGQSRQHTKKQRHYFANKGLSSQSCGFSSSHAWMWELDYKKNCMLKNWCFWDVVLEKTLESPLGSRSNQYILKEISSEYSLEGLMLKLKLQYFGHLMQRIEAGGEGDNRRWDCWMASLTQWTWVWVNSRSWWWSGRPGMLQSMGWRVGNNEATKLNWLTEWQTLFSWAPKSLWMVTSPMKLEGACCLEEKLLQI